MSDNAFRPSLQKDKTKGFLETHGLALGGGALALGMMMVGSQYLSQDDLKADLTEETVVASAEVSEATKSTDVVEAEIPVTEQEVVATEAETSTESEAETGSEPITEGESDVEEGVVAEESVEKEADSAVSDTESTNTQSETVIVTNPVTANIAPLYADPVADESGNIEIVEAAEEIIRAPAGLLSSVPVAPLVPAAIRNAPLQKEGVIESQEQADLTPVIPQ